MYGAPSSGPFGPINTGVPAAIMAITIAGKWDLVGGVALVTVAAFNLLLMFRARRLLTRSFA